MTNWHWRDLFVDHQTGKLRETLIWSNLGKVGLSIWFGTDIYYRTATTDQAMVFASIVVLHELGSRFFNQRQQVIDKDAKP